MNTEARFRRDKALPYLESRRACHSRICYQEHSHPTYSIGAVDLGGSLFTGAPGGPVRLSPGSLVFIPAHRTHACNPLPGQAWSYQMLHLDAAWLARLQQESGLAPDEPIRVCRDQAAYRAYCALNDLLFSCAPTLNKEAALIEFLMRHGSAQGAVLAEAPRPDPAVQAILEQWSQDLLQNASLQELACQTGLSRYQLIRAFQRHTGLTPHRWQQNHRINLARKALLTGGALAEIAYHLGFADQSHFQRVFKHYTGVTPGQYRR